MGAMANMRKQFASRHSSALHVMLTACLLVGGRPFGRCARLIFQPKLLLPNIVTADPGIFAISIRLYDCIICVNVLQKATK